jgi:hypothetical protein
LIKEHHFSLILKGIWWGGKSLLVFSFNICVSLKKNGEQRKAASSRATKNNREAKMASNGIVGHWP